MRKHENKLSIATILLALIVLAVNIHQLIGASGNLFLQALVAIVLIVVILIICYIFTKHRKKHRRKHELNQIKQNVLSSPKEQKKPEYVSKFR